MSELADLESVQPDVFAYISADPYLAAVSKFLIRQSRMQTLIDQALSADTFDAGQSGCLPGAVIEVLMPTISTDTPDAPGPLCTLEMRLLVKENPDINLALNPDNSPAGTGLTAEQIGARLVQLLHFWQIEGIKDSFYPAPSCLTPNRDYLPLVAYDVVMHCTLLFTALDRCATPTIAEGPPLTLTLVCATGGASLYYTTDGSPPWSGNAAATLYSAPFAVSSGTVLRFAAFATNFIPSQFCRAQIT